MARTPAKNGKASEAMATTLMLPKTKTLTSLLDTKGTQLKRASNATGVYRQAVGTAKEKDHLDTWAWATASKMAEMQDDTLHVRYFHLLHYLEELGVTKRATAQEEMFSAGETGPKLGDEDDGDEHSTTKRIGRAARQVAEAAGATLASD
jgi:hypothetical protein